MGFFVTRVRAQIFAVTTVCVLHLLSVTALRKAEYKLGFMVRYYSRSSNSSVQGCLVRCASYSRSSAVKMPCEKRMRQDTMQPDRWMLLIHTSKHDCIRDMYKGGEQGSARGINKRRLWKFVMG